MTIGELLERDTSLALTLIERQVTLRLLDRLATYGVTIDGPLPHVTDWTSVLSQTVCVPDTLLEDAQSCNA